MKKVLDEIREYPNGKVRIVEHIINCCSWRRAKKFTRGYFMNGTHKGKYVNWKGSMIKISYSRPNRRLYITRTSKVN